jgi:hypothetical protein
LPLPAMQAGCLIQPIKMPLLTGGVPTGAEVASGHATGVFFLEIHNESERLRSR